MQEFSKYRMITAGFILMFVFIIAAIYTNTKDIAAKKIKNSEISENNQVINQEETPNLIQNNFTPSNSSDNPENEEINERYSKIAERLDALERKVNAPTNNLDEDKSVRCTVRGIINDGHFVPLSTEEALNESRTNNKEVLITCLFK